MPTFLKIGVIIHYKKVLPQLTFESEHLAVKIRP